MTTRRMTHHQRGIGAIGLTIILLIVGYGGYVGIQLVPQLIEAQSVQSILHTMREENKPEKPMSELDIERAWNRYLNINDMNYLQDAIEVNSHRGQFTIDVRYQRNLDLLYENRVIEYHKSVSLD